VSVKKGFSKIPTPNGVKMVDIDYVKY